MATYRAELVWDGKVIKIFQEDTNENWSDWRFKKALKELEPRGAEIRWYIDGKRKLS